jgi:hypothetical protein
MQVAAILEAAAIVARAGAARAEIMVPLVDTVQELRPPSEIDEAAHEARVEQVDLGPQRRSAR